MQVNEELDKSSARCVFTWLIQSHRQLFKKVSINTYSGFNATIPRKLSAQPAEKTRPSSVFTFEWREGLCVTRSARHSWMSAKERSEGVVTLFSSLYEVLFVHGASWNNWTWIYGSGWWHENSATVRHGGGCAFWPAKRTVYLFFL